MAGSYHTGRAGRIRDFLSRHPNEAFTAREIFTEIEPGGSIDLVAASLSQMAANGDIARQGAGKARVHYYWPRGQAKPDKRRGRAKAATKAKPAAATARAVAKRTVHKATAQTRSAAAIARRISAMAKAKRLAAPLPDLRPPRRVETNFPAPLATVDHSLDPRRAASARIAADIAEFQRRGGRIERLGVTKLFHHPDDFED